MTGSDEYSPEVKPHQRNNRQDSHERHYQTVQEDSLASILVRLRVSADFNRELPIPGEYWPNGEPLYLKPDAFIHDKFYGWGVIEVDGGIHKTHGQRRWDERKDAYYLKSGYWVERIENKDVKRPIVEALLEKHKRKIEEFP